MHSDRLNYLYWAWSVSVVFYCFGYPRASVRSTTDYADALFLCLDDYFRKVKIIN